MATARSIRPKSYQAFAGTAPTVLRTAAAARDNWKAGREIVDGLTRPDACASPKFLYDTLGSRLFEAITALPEYYPTRTEETLLARHGTEIAMAAGSGSTLIDLGAGNCGKAAHLFGALQPAQYVAVDISVAFLRAALAGLQSAYPGVEMIAVGADISCGILLPDAVRPDERLFLYLGSSIGNFTPEEALGLLAQIRNNCGESGSLVIGVDLVKPVEVLERAYDDALGVTAAFNLNLLHHLNALIGSDFDVRDWKHRAFYNPDKSRIEMHLEARSDVSVRWPGGERGFCKGESIHTENSYKYALQDFQALLVRAGFRLMNAWTDDKGWFALCHAGV